MSDVLPPAQYGMPGRAGAGFQRWRDCGCSLSEAVTRLRHAITAHELWILHEIDPQALASRAGVAIGPARQILFFHPRYVARLLAADSSSLIEAPLKLVLLEAADGVTTVRWLDPGVSLRRYANPALAALGQELSSLCADMIASAFDPAQAEPMNRLQDLQFRNHDNDRR